MLTNPNRFIHGLSDIGEIFDDKCLECPPTVESPSQEPEVVLGSAPIPSGGGSPLTPDNFVEFEQTLTSNGGQNLTLEDSDFITYELFINGLRQVKAAYSLASNVLILPTTLNLFAGDVITFAYMK
jgi:hypothetical protein